MNKTEKQEQINYIVEKFQNAKSVIFANYRGLNVQDITDLRRKLRQAKASIKVVKNRLAKRALKEVSVEGLESHLTGPTAMASSDFDPVMPAKILVNFAKDHEVFKIKAGYMDGKVIDLNLINTIARLPSREVLLSKMLGAIKAPITNFTLALAAIPRQLVNVVDAIAKQKKQ